MRHEIVFFVSPHGNNRWSGRFPEPLPDGDDGPFATLDRAKTAVLKLRKKGGHRGVVRIQLRGGTYHLSRPVVLTAAISGTEKHPVIIEAFRGERPILSGGRRINDWSEGTVNGKRAWIASLPDVAAGDWNFTQLFVNGVRRPRTRLPKEGFYRFRGVPEGVVSEKTISSWFTGPDAALFADQDIRPWKNLGDVELTILQLWFEIHHRIRAVDPKQQRVTFRAKSTSNLRDDRNPEEYARYYVENVGEALENPGEWYLDRRTGKLTYLPLPGERPETTAVIAPRLSSLVRLEGTLRQPVRRIRFENIAFHHAEWTYPYDDLGSIQAAFKVPGAVVFDHAEDCILYGCEVAHVAQYGVEMKTGCSGNRVVACSIHDMGAGGVRIGHEWMERTNETSLRRIKARAGAKPMAAVVSDCQIHDGSFIHLSAIGVWIGNSGRNRILRNHIFNLNYTGISCGWTWGYARTATVGNRLEDNHIHHINWNRLLSDNGGIYTLGIQPGAVVRGNHIHHIGCYGYGGWGIYPDEGSSEIVFENNLVHHTDEAGFSTHYGRDNVIRNNIFALSGKNHIHPGKTERHRTTIFKRNIVFWRGGQLRSDAWCPPHFLFRDNLFWNDGESLDFGEDLTLEDWLKRRQHRGTLIADPLFLDPDGGDFALRADSPAVQLGFRPLDLSRTRPLVYTRRALSFADWPKEPEDRRPIVRTRLERLGLKSFRVVVENAGSAPATGRLAFRAFPADAASVPGSATFRFRGLPPGKTKSAEIPLVITPSAERIWVESTPATADIQPALQFFTVREPEWRVLRLRPLPSAAAVPAALAGQTPRLLSTMKGRIIAEFRAAVAGDRLALVARVCDPTLRRGNEVWEGSCIEVFTHDCDRAARTTGRPRREQLADIRQSFLLPAVGECAAQGAYQAGREFRPTAEIQVCSTPLADGYELAALLPLSLLKIMPKSKRFGLELRLFTTLTEGGEFKPFLLFGALSPHRDREGCATVLVE